MQDDLRDFFSDLSDWVPAGNPVSEMSQILQDYVAALPEISFKALEPEKQYAPELEFFDLDEFPSPYEHEEISLDIDGNLWDVYNEIYEEYEDEDIDDTYAGGK